MLKLFQMPFGKGYVARGSGNRVPGLTQELDALLEWEPKDFGQEGLLRHVPNLAQGPGTEQCRGGTGGVTPSWGPPAHPAWHLGFAAPAPPPSLAPEGLHRIQEGGPVGWVDSEEDPNQEGEPEGEGYGEGLHLHGPVGGQGQGGDAGEPKGHPRQPSPGAQHDGFREELGPNVPAGWRSTVARTLRRVGWLNHAVFGASDPRIRPKRLVHGFVSGNLR
jgi:hypothetical protein